MAELPTSIATPCVGLCVLAKGSCRGCGRTLAEIAAWSALSEADRLRVMAMLPGRRMRLKP